MTNMGKVDRAVRLLVGIVLIAGAFALGWGGTGLWHWIVAAVGAVLVVTAAVGICPAYLPFGLRTCARR